MYRVLSSLFCKISWQPIKAYGMIPYMCPRWENKRQFVAHLRNRRLELALSQEQVSIRLGKSIGYIQQLERSKGAFIPAAEVLLHLATIYEEEPREYISIRENKNSVPNAADTLVNLLINESKADHPIKSVPVPVIGLAQCDKWVDFRDLDFPVANAGRYEDAPTKDPNAFYIRAEGDSMSPIIQEGDLILVEPNEDRDSGHIVLAQTDKGKVVKRLHITADGKIMLLSENSQYPPIPIKSKRGFIAYRVSSITRKV